MTTKQMKAVDLISTNINSDSPKPMKVILEEAGYTPSTAQASTRIVQSKTFVEALEAAGVTDDKLSRVMEEGLAANRNGEPDHAVRHKYLETAIKVKGHIGADTPKGDTYNTWIQQNNLNPNKVDARTLVDNTLEMLMNDTKRDINTDS